MSATATEASLDLAPGPMPVLAFRRLVHCSVSLRARRPARIYSGTGEDPRDVAAPPPVDDRDFDGSEDRELDEVA
jgi:hypothetical protein